MALHTYQTTVKYYGEEKTFLLKMKKESAATIESKLRDVVNISPYIIEKTGIVGGQERESVLYCMFGKNELREPEVLQAKVIQFIESLPDLLTIDHLQIIKNMKNELVNEHACIRDNRRTVEKIAEDNQKSKENQIALAAENQERENLINLFHPQKEKISLGDDEMFLTIKAYFNNSDPMTDYFDAHSSLSNTYAIGKVKKGAQREALARIPVEAIPELNQLTWTWNTENYSMGHGNYLQSSKVGTCKKHSYNGRGEVGYWYEIQFNSYEKEMTKSRFYMDVQAPKGVEILGQTDTAIIQENMEKNGIEIKFPDKPEPEVINRLKANGWRWSGFNKVWYHKRSDQARKFAEELCGGVEV